MIGVEFHSADERCMLCERNRYVARITIRSYDHHLTILNLCDSCCIELVATISKARHSLALQP